MSTTRYLLAISLALNIILALYMYSLSLKSTKLDIYSKNLIAASQVVIAAEGRNKSQYELDAYRPIIWGRKLKCVNYIRGEWGESFCFYTENGKYFGQL